PFPMFVADAGGCIESVNAAFEALLPHREGTSWFDAFIDIDRERFHREWREIDGGSAPLTIKGKVANTGGGFRYFDVVCQSLDGAEAERQRVLGILLDVTEKTLREAENLAILETAVDAIIMIDEAGIVETFNRAATQLFGYEPEEIIGKSVNLLMPEPHRSRHDQYMRRYMETGEKRIIGIGRELHA